MSRAGAVLVLGFMVLVLAQFPESCIANEEVKNCTPSSCGNIGNISYPFRLKGDPVNCSDYLYELACENNRTTLYLCSGKYYVQEISYVNQAIRVVDSNLDENSCSIPLHSSFYEQSSCVSSPFWLFDYYAIVFLNCKTAVNSSKYVDPTPCFNNNHSSSSPKSNVYAFYGYLSVSDIPDQCSVQVKFPALFFNFSSPSIFDIHRHLLKGFELGWVSSIYNGTPINIPDWNQKSSFKERVKSWFRTNFWDELRFKEFSDEFWDDLRYYLFSGRVASLIIKGFIIERTFLGILFLIAFSIYKFQRRHWSDDIKIEEFLQTYNKLMPIRYSYSEIKEMTKGFQDKLGQGGFGSVYKGKSRSGELVAIKVLASSKANGQDFVSEVATIGRIYHVNVVRLIGFCVEGSKQALIYEFMANGSLDKLISCKGKNNNLLSWERMHEIGLGAARGIEYLHRGCDMQILHFDIKPHNILLDENFVPKISDFGLAKLYPVNDSIVSLTAIRGTPGYIAPELFYKNIGGISYKADVYSFGMMLMEMVGKRRNPNALIEQSSHSSQIYFPSWVYNRISQGEDIELGDANEDEKKISRKLIMIALWCIQLKPMDRPSMSKVLEMLEGEVELLQMPPKPFLYPQEMSVDHEDNNQGGALISSYNDIGTITLDVR